jgi:DNA-binding transcriptional regulator YdaS (Cro superfamily)
MSEAPLKRALDAAGGPSALGRELGISSAAVSQWEQVPPLRVLDVERITGVPRHELRPDLYPPPVNARRAEPAGAGA